jgi:radical SAM superfamily enzyme YgiQ (UPF0313 family)
LKLKLLSVGRLPWYSKNPSAHSFFYPRLGLAYIAAATPPDWEVEIFEGVEVTDIDFQEKVDLVGFSVLTPFAHDTYKAASFFQKNGVGVVMGGPHPTLMPQEVKEYADAVVIGEGENIWPKLIDDFKNKRLKDFYRSDEPADMASLPTPNYSILNKKDYTSIKAIQIIRGCPYGEKCKFCIVPQLFGNKPRFMPIEKAVKRIILLHELQSEKELLISGCCSLNNWDYIASFALAVKNLNIKWRGSGQLTRLDNDQLIKLLRESGCRCIYTESGSVSKKKDSEEYEKICNVIKKIHDNGIRISYNFTVGFDDESVSVFEDIKNFVEETHLHKDMCFIQLFVPWPNTPAYNTLDGADRIINKNWKEYNNTKVVYIPKLMSVQELTENFYKNLRL